MARVELAVAAVEDLDRMIRTHSLPADTRARVARSLRSLVEFPKIGPALAGRWDGYRFILGPWRWLVLVYIFIEEEDRVVVVTIQDARSSTAITSVQLSTSSSARFCRSARLPDLHNRPAGGEPLGSLPLDCLRPEGQNVPFAR